MQTFRFPDVTASILSINFTDEICGSVCGGGGGHVLMIKSYHNIYSVEYAWELELIQK